MTVDDLMGLRTVNDVRISPDGRHVAYTVSTPSYEPDSHETVLYVVAAAGGEPTRLIGRDPDPEPPASQPGAALVPGRQNISFLSPVQGMPQVMAIARTAGKASHADVSERRRDAYEWSPDGRDLAYVSAIRPRTRRHRQRRDKTFVIQVDRQDRPVRLWRQAVGGGAPQSLIRPTSLRLRSQLVA